MVSALIESERMAAFFLERLLRYLYECTFECMRTGRCKIRDSASEFYVCFFNETNPGCGPVYVKAKSV